MPPKHRVLTVRLPWRRWGWGSGEDKRSAWPACVSPFARQPHGSGPGELRRGHRHAACVRHQPPHPLGAGLARAAARPLRSLPGGGGDAGLSNA